MSRNNPLVQALALVIAVVFLGLAFVVGAVLIAVLLAIGAIAALAIAARIWWLQRKISAAAARSPSTRSAQQAIEGEYTVVDESDAKAGGRRSIARADAQSHPRKSTD